MSINILPEEVLKEVQEKIDKMGLRGAARRYGISPALLNEIHKRRREISEKTADKMGFIREKIIIISFRRKH